MRRANIWMPVAALGLVVLMSSGCARRDDPVSQQVSGDSGEVIKFTLDYSPNGYGYLPYNGEGLTLTESPLRTSKTYVPPHYRRPGQGRPYPVLYMLLDFGGNGQTDDVTDEYYFEVGLKLLLDSLINAGIIKPMIVATVDLHNAYGGSWFASNNVQGLYEECLTEFVAYTDTALNVSTLTGRESRGIAGVGMGGYGALIMAMKYPNLFASASSISGHLAFTRSSTKHGFDGVQTWAVKVFEENFVSPLPPGVPPTPEATLPYYSMFPDINRPLRKPYTNLVFSMAAAFSPFDAAIVTGADSVTWMNAALGGGAQRDWKVTLPFDYTGFIWPHTWENWQSYDVSAILSANPVALAEVETLIMVGTSTEFDILAQNRIFNEVAIARGASTVHYMEFDGYGDYPTSRRRYLDRTIREVLKFHSDQFVDSDVLGP